MPSWLEDIAGPNFAPAVLWTLLALVVLVIVLVVVRIVRSMTFGTFVAGGRNRKTRLAVMDAAAVDSQRRLVLVRRDDVEHLILIGGPTDVVVERDIRLHAPTRRPGPPGRGRAWPRAASRSNAGRLPAAGGTSRTTRRPSSSAAAAAAKPPVPPANAAPVRMPSLAACPAAQFLDAAAGARRPRRAPAPEAPRQTRSAGNIDLDAGQKKKLARNDARGRDEPSARRAFEQAVGYRRRRHRFTTASSGGPT